MTDYSRPTPSSGSKRTWLMIVLALQVSCILFLASEAGFELFGLEFEDLLGIRDWFEILVVAALTLGAVFIGLEVRAMLRRQKVMEHQLMAASGAFNDLLEQHFTDWGLTASERDVALMAIKGLSIAEIAELRQTAPGTVKAQCNKIYTKAGVSGRPQLLSLFIEELMAGPLSGPQD
jgi:DNA-binding CsgD family transcriptional regulator